MGSVTKLMNMITAVILSLTPFKLTLVIYFSTNDQQAHPIKILIFMFTVNNINVNLEKLQWCGSSPSLPIFIIIVIMYYVLLFQYLYYIYIYCSFDIFT